MPGWHARASGVCARARVACVSIGLGRAPRKRAYARTLPAARACSYLTTGGKRPELSLKLKGLPLNQDGLPPPACRQIEVLEVMSPAAKLAAERKAAAAAAAAAQEQEEGGGA